MKYSFVHAGAAVVVAAFGLQACADRASEKTGGHPSILEDSGGGSAETGVGGSSGARSRVGSKCVQDRDCGSGLQCLLSTGSEFSGGGPPNGVCTADCSSDDSLCSKQIDTGSICVHLSQTSGGPAYCMEKCSIGPAVTATDKCHGRDDMACDDTGSTVPGAGFCSPQCRNDADCGTRVCDLGSGLCRDAKDITGTLGIGENCDPNLTRDPCKGFCIPSSSSDAGLGPGWCTGLCAIGQLGCGATAGSDPAPTAACLFALSDSSDLGDIGLCGQLCDCNDDCKTTGRVCRPFSDQERQAYGREGYCGGAVNRTTNQPAENLPCSGTKHDAGVKPHVDSGAPSPKDSGKD